jgi:hypothetical protein
MKRVVTPSAGINRPEFHAGTSMFVIIIGQSGAVEMFFS